MDDKNRSNRDNVHEGQANDIPVPGTHGEISLALKRVKEDVSQLDAGEFEQLLLHMADMAQTVWLDGAETDMAWIDVSVLLKTAYRRVKERRSN